MVEFVHACVLRGFCTGLVQNGRTNNITRGGNSKGTDDKWNLVCTKMSGHRKYVGFV